VTKTRIAVLLAIAGLVVALLVSRVAGSGAAARCDVAASACLDLARTLSLRAGLFAGGMTVVMLLLVAGLGRMMVLDEQQRIVRAREGLERRGPLA
jgi:hypothetical protein